MTNYLANENVPGDGIRAARQAGFDVAWIKEIAAGASDETVLGLSMTEQRVLLTFDKDFGEMAFRKGTDSSCGVILFRPRLRSPEFLAKFIVEVLNQPIDWTHHFSVAQESGIRVIPLPNS
jgi:predicted nuclease of predicted toxin-antitoxin system